MEHKIISLNHKDPRYKELQREWDRLLFADKAWYREITDRIAQNKIKRSKLKD